METINPHVKLLSGGTSPICSLCRSNSSFDTQNDPIYIFRYATMSKGNKCTIEKVFSCSDSGVFACEKPCVLLLKDSHYLNVWNHVFMFNEVDCPALGKKRPKDKKKKSLHTMGKYFFPTVPHCRRGVM